MEGTLTTRMAHVYPIDLLNLENSDDEEYRLSKSSNQHKHDKGLKRLGLNETHHADFKRQPSYVNLEQLDEVEEFPDISKYIDSWDVDPPEQWSDDNASHGPEKTSDKPQLKTSDKFQDKTSHEAQAKTSDKHHVTTKAMNSATNISDPAKTAVELLGSKMERKKEESEAARKYRKRKLELNLKIFDFEQEKFKAEGQRHEELLSALN
ncbi:uncharacterized protein LOC107043471 [Diachasma alloeum]|uniref:uncharacterized protein LOC107043471 n=1 Tax=Diachasma alloeum TaxID=454923 RepID=UPI0007384978|nr:uncharacterized protein LOC107043471 [Diachasma alloeum]